MRTFIIIIFIGMLGYACQKESIQRSEYVNLYIPNAFYPNSTCGNYDFKPVIGYNGGSITKWEFTIWNDQQQKVFFTYDFTTGWNGKLLNTGNECKMGAYTYIIKYKDNTYKDFYVEGGVMLRR